jgi:hypothetical protein
MNRLSTLFSLWTLQGLAAFLWLALLPTDAEHGLIFGFSASRLALLGIALALTGISATLTWFSRRTDFSIPEQIQSPLYLLSVFVTVSAPAAILILRALGKTSGFTYTAYAERLTPLAFWLALSALELAIWQRKEERGKKEKHDLRAFFRLSSFFFIVLAAVTAFTLITNLGLTRLNDGSWGEPTTPLLEWQILLALVASLAYISLESRWLWLRKDRYTCFLVYLFTCFLWLSQPINPGYFATPPRAPNFEIYPFSDALIYAQYAQSALAGNGFLWPDVPTRPLYITFITWLHALAGQDYAQVIMLQTLVLAAFPVILYLLGKELAGRPLGLGLALLAIFRDLTANIAAPFALNYTYTKLFFSEIPAALLISLFTLMVVRWMRQSKPLWYVLLAGGILGLSSLIRLQSVVVLVAVIPISFFVLKNRKKWLAGSALMVVGVALALIPWLARNYRATSGLVLDNPISQTMVLARRWSGNNGNQLLPYLPGEGDAQYSSRMSGLALASLRENPGRILGSAVNHFFNNEIDNLLVFPLRDQLNSPGELIWPEHAFWQTWAGQPAPGQIPVIVFYLVLLGLGLATAWRKNGLVGLLPLALTLVYNAWTALFLSSGDRFLVPVDWAVYLYLFLGLLTLASFVARGQETGAKQVSAWIFAPSNGETGGDKIVPLTWRKIWLTAAAILLLGAIVPLTELAFPRQYPLPNTPLSPGAEVTLHGRAIYPRWYDASEGEPGSAKLGYGVSDEARLVFFLVGEENTLVIFPLKAAPKSFPNATDITVTGIQEDGFVRAQKIDGKSVEYLP